MNVKMVIVFLRVCRRGPVHPVYGLVECAVVPYLALRELMGVLVVERVITYSHIKTFGSRGSNFLSMVYPTPDKPRNKPRLNPVPPAFQA